MLFREEDREKLNCIYDRNDIEAKIIDEFFLAVQSINCAVKGMEKDMIDMRQNISGIREILVDYAYLLQTRHQEKPKKPKKEPATTKKAKKNVVPKQHKLDENAAEHA